MDIMLERVIELIGPKHGATKELAEAIGVSANLITDWKGGRAKSYTKYAPQIAEYYGVSLDWLSGLSDQKEKPAPQAEDELDAEIIKLYGLLNAKNQAVVLEFSMVCGFSYIQVQHIFVFRPRQKLQSFNGF